MIGSEGNNDGFLDAARQSDQEELSLDEASGKTWEEPSAEERRLPRRFAAASVNSFPPTPKKLPTATTLPTTNRTTRTSWRLSPELSSLC
jgi:hypothetical protein